MGMSLDYGVMVGRQQAGQVSIDDLIPVGGLPAQSGVINLVSDCGADPTGVVDAGPALTKAGQLLTALASSPAYAANPLRLFIPPGQYNVASSPALVHFSGLTTSVEVFGCGDASVFLLNSPGLSWLFGYLLCFRVHFHDFAVLGMQTAVSMTPDADLVIVTSSEELTIVERVNFQAILVTTSIVRSSQAPTRMVACRFGGCASNNSAFGVFSAFQVAACEILQCQWSDPAQLNGQLFPSKSGGCHNYIRVDDALGFNSPSYIVIDGCQFDESTLRVLHIQGGPTSNIQKVSLTNCQMNPTSLGGATAMVFITNVNVFEADGVSNSGFNPVVTPAFFQFAGVGAAHLSALLNNPADASGYVLADAATKTVVVRDCAGVDFSRINNPTIIDIDDPRSSAVALTATQVVVVGGQQLVQATTLAGGAAVTVDTFYKPPNNHGAKLDVVWDAYDVATPATRVGNGNAAVRENAGATVIAGSTFGGSVGDAGLATAAVTLGVSGAGTITVTVTPPVGYANPLAWVIGVTPTETPAFT